MALGTTQSTPEVAITQEVAIEGVAVLASVPANAVALVLEDELHPAFSGRLLQLLRGGWPGGPDVLTLLMMYQRLQHELNSGRRAACPSSNTATRSVDSVSIRI